MTTSSPIVRNKFRIDTLLKQCDQLRQLSPIQRWSMFFDLQDSMARTYWKGLKNRYPDYSEEELKKIALEEAIKRNEIRKKLRRSI